MNINFPKDFREFVGLLEKHSVRYLIVGGYAVGFHGYPRFTGDLDIWIEISTLNAFKMMAVINDFGFGTLGIQENDFLQEGNIIQLGYPPLRIDLLTEIDGVTFEDCFEKRVQVNFEEFKYNFINYDDLLKNKKASSRPKDIDDFEYFTKR